MLYKEIQLKNGQTCILRQPQEDDAQNILDYLNYVCSETDFLTFGHGEMNFTLEEEKKYINDHLELDNKILIIAEVNRTIVGMSGFTGGKTKRIFHIGEFGISVSREYWNLGIGRALIENVIEWAKQSGVIYKIELRVRVDNKLAIKLYKDVGFIREGTISRQFFIGDIFYDAYIMGLNIDN